MSKEYIKKAGILSLKFRGSKCLRRMENWVIRSDIQVKSLKRFKVTQSKSNVHLYRMNEWDI